MPAKEEQSSGSYRKLRRCGRRCKSLEGRQPKDIAADIVDKIRQVVLHTLWDAQPRPPRTATPRTPLRAEIIAGWKADPDSATFARWLDCRVPMGCDEPIQNNGVFPQVKKKTAELEAQQSGSQDIGGLEELHVGHRGKRRTAEAQSGI